MYEELVKRLRTECTLPFQTLQLMHEAADAIEELSVVVRAQKAVLDKFPRWIPVTERLPDEHIPVLVINDDAKHMIAERTEDDWWYRYFAYDVNRWDENEQGTITHWMPLPEPPREE